MEKENSDEEGGEDKREEWEEKQRNGRELN